MQLTPERKSVTKKHQHMHCHRRDFQLQLCQAIAMYYGRGDASTNLKSIHHPALLHLETSHPQQIEQVPIELAPVPHDLESFSADDVVAISWDRVIFLCPTSHCHWHSAPSMETCRGSTLKECLE